MATASNLNSGVKSAMRTLDLIEYVVSNPGGVVASEIAGVLAIPLSSLSYLLATLTERDYLRREGRRYYAGHGLARLRSPHIEYPLADRARPLIKALRLQLNETSSLFVPTGWDMEAVLTETSSQTLRYAIDVGTHTPLYCVAAGKALLASMSDAELDRYFSEVKLEKFTPYTISDPKVLMEQLTEIRRTGIGFTRDEYTIGISGVGAAVMAGGQAIAAIGVAAPSPRYTPEMEARIVEQLLKSAHALSSDD